jgi:hypothetical protein
MTGGTIPPGHGDARARRLDDQLRQLEQERDTLRRELREHVLQALRELGCHPVEVSPGRWLAICPGCGRLELIVGGDSPATPADRDAWLDAMRGRT